jgi:putative endonuclease
MYCVYLLKNLKNAKLYIGYSENLKRRLTEHNRVERKWELIYYEAYKDKRDALVREKRLKLFANAYAQLKRRLKNSLPVWLDRCGEESPNSSRQSAC